MDHNVYKFRSHYFTYLFCAILIPISQPVFSQSVPNQVPNYTDTKPSYEPTRNNFSPHRTISHNSVVTRPQLEQGQDGTMYLVHYDFRRGQEKIDPKAYGREYWTSPYVKHPNYGVRYVYLVDRHGHRVNPKLYIENNDGELTIRG